VNDSLRAAPQIGFTLKTFGCVHPDRLFDRGENTRLCVKAPMKLSEYGVGAPLHAKQGSRPGVEIGRTSGHGEVVDNSGSPSVIALASGAPTGCTCRQTGGRDGRGPHDGEEEAREPQDFKGERVADAVDLDRGQLAVRRTVTPVKGKMVYDGPKTKRSRRNIDIRAQDVAVLRAARAEQAANKLRAGPAWHDLGLVLCQADGSPIRCDWPSRFFTRVCAELELPQIGLHGLRHTHATLLLQAGVSDKVVSERLGHASTAFTKDVYGHVTEAMQREATSALDRLMGGL
jgi:hypothetical protein